MARKKIMPTRKSVTPKVIVETKDFEGDTVRLYFEDESKKIGAGYRMVTIKRIGYKWVELVNSKGRGTKLKRSVWDNIVSSKANKDVFTGA